MDFWKLNCCVGLEFVQSTFTYPNLTPEQRMFYARQYYRDPSPYESDEGLVPSAKDTATTETSERTSSPRKARTKKRPEDGTGLNNETPEPNRIRIVATELTGSNGAMVDDPIIEDMETVLHVLVATAERTSR